MAEGKAKNLLENDAKENLSELVLQHVSRITVCERKT
jgi:hypothetical protein